MSMLAYMSATSAVEGSPESVRSTMTVIEDDPKGAVQDAAPTARGNIQKTDPDTGGGLTGRSLADYVAPEPGAPYPMLLANVDASDEVVNHRISTLGRAASEEEAGRWGGRPIRASMALEPLVSEGTAFSETYFARTRVPIVSDNGNWIEPLYTADPATRETAIAMGERNRSEARAMANRDLYTQFLGQVAGQ